MTQTSKRVLLIISCSIFFFFGLFHASLGPVLSELAARTNSSLTAIGGVLTFLFLGALVAQIVTGPLFDRFGKRFILIISLLLLGLSIISFTYTLSISWMFFLFLLAGLGQGGIDMGVNLVVADAYQEKNTRYLNLIHFFFGLGAFTGPLFVGLSIQKMQTGLTVQWLAACAMIVLSLAVLIFARDPSIVIKSDDIPDRTFSDGFKVYSSPLLWILGSVMLIYIGVEYGLGSWVSSFMGLTTGLSARDGALITSAYWGALALGRLASLGLSKRLSRVRLLLFALTGSLVGAFCLLIFRDNVIPSIICLVWISFSYGTVIPTTVALASASFPENKGKAVSVLSAMGNIGGTTIPWIAGVFLGRVMVVDYLFLIGLFLIVLVVLIILVGKMLAQHHMGDD